MKGSSKVVPIILVLAVLAGGGWALKNKLAKPQAQAGASFPGGPMGGPMGGPGQFAEMQKAHKYGFQLMKLVGSIGRLEESGNATLSPAQAKSLLAILQPPRKLPVLNEPDARDAVIKVQGVLTDAQRQAISALPPMHQFRQGGPPPGPRPGGAPMGPPPGIAGRPMRGFNPLNPPPGGRFGGRRANMMENLFKDLEAKAQKAG